MGWICLRGVGVKYASVEFFEQIKNMMKQDFPLCMVCAPNLSSIPHWNWTWTYNNNSLRSFILLFHILCSTWWYSPMSVRKKLLERLCFGTVNVTSQSQTTSRFQYLQAICVTVVLDILTDCQWLSIHQNVLLVIPNLVLFSYKVSVIRNQVNITLLSSSACA